jgi:hypothetical protein
MSLCDTCENKRKTWSDELPKEGYNGCILLYDAETQKDINNIVDNIEADVIGTGWVTLGSFAVNNQLIVKNVVSCKNKIKL